MFLKAIGNGHPLMDLVHRCINNDPQCRPHTKEIARTIGEVASWFPATFTNKLEMLRRLEAVQEEKRALAEEGERIHANRQEILRQFEEVKEEKRALAEEVERIHANRLDILRQCEAVQEEKMTLAEEVERIHTNRLEILGQLETVQEEKRTLAEEGERIYTVLMEKDATISAMSEQLIKARQYPIAQQQVSTYTIFEYRLFELQNYKFR